MSADNWTRCPRCAEKDPFMGTNDRTFREDYDIGLCGDVEAPLFEIDYRGGCGVCGLTVEFKHSMRVQPERMIRLDRIEQPRQARQSKRARA